MKINEFFYHLKGRDDFVTKNHTHNEIELIECVSGSGSVLKSDRLYPLHERYLYIIDARRPHIVHPEDCAQYIRNKIVIDADSFWAFISETGLTETVEKLLEDAPVATEENEKIDCLFEKITTLCQNGEQTALGFAHGYILQILHFAAGNNLKNTDSAPQSEILKKVLAFIAKSDGVTSLREISEKLHINKYYLCHFFKEKTGMTLSEYLAEKRYAKSLYLLSENKYSIETISSLCGFAASSSFTRFFKKRCGISPNEYRKQ